MTKAQISDLLHCVKWSHYNARIGIEMFMRRNPALHLTSEMLNLAVGVGRLTFPNIVGLPEGPFPVFKDRPFYDYRMWNRPGAKEWEEIIERL